MLERWGSEPSPLVGEVTHAVYEMQLDNGGRTLEEAKHAARELLSKAGEESGTGGSQ